MSSSTRPIVVGSVLTLMSIGAASRLGAEQITWTGGAGDGKWSSTANWDLGRAPASGDDVRIEVNGSYSVTLDVDATIGSIRLGASSGTQSLDIVAHQFTLEGPSESQVDTNGVLTLQGGTITSNGKLSNGGAVVCAGVSALHNATSFSNVAGATLRIHGRTNGQHARATFAAGIINAGLVELVSDGNSWQSQLFVTNGTLINEPGGETRISPGTGGGSRLLATQLDNQGEFNVNYACTIDKDSAAHTNSGTIDVAGGNLTLTQSGTTPSFTNTGAIAVSNGRTLTIDGGVFNQNAGSIEGDSGTLVLTSTTAKFDTDFTNGPLELTLKSSTLNGPGDLSNAGLVTVINSTVNADVINQDGAILDCLGTSALNGSFTQDSGATLRIYGRTDGQHARVTFAEGFNNGGLIELLSDGNSWQSRFFVTNGTLVNEPGGEIRISPGTGGGSRLLAAQLDNQGAINVNFACTIDKSSAAHTNSGTMHVTDGNLTLTQSGTTPSFTNTGTIAVSNDRTLTISGGVFNQEAGSIEGDSGTLALIDTTAKFETDFTNSPLQLTLKQSTFNGPGILTNAGLVTVVSSTVNADVINQDGAILDCLGTSALNGDITQDAAATIRIYGRNDGQHARVTFAQGFTNAGLVELLSDGNAWQSHMFVTNGALQNESGGEIRVSPGTGGGSRFMSIELDNQGAVSINHPCTIDKSSANHINGGTINVSGANLTLTQSGGDPTFTNTGTLKVGNARTFTISGGTFDHDAGSIEGDGGTLVLSDATASFEPDFTNGPLRLVLRSTVFNGPGTLTNAETLVVIGSTINTNLINQDGAILECGGTSAFNGALEQHSAATLRVYGRNDGQHARVTFAEALSNPGLIELLSDGNGWQSQLFVTNGSLTNETGGEIRVSPGTGGGARLVAAQLDNRGAININHSCTIAKSAADHINAGTIDVLGGNLTITQSGDTPTFASSGTIDVSAGRTVRVETGAITQTAGDLLLAGTLTLSSVTLNLDGGVLQGTGQINGAVDNAGGIVAPGFSVGTLTIDGDYTQATNATLAIELAGDVDGTFDRLVVSGTANLDGGLDATPIDGFSPEGGDRFDFLAAGQRTGEFSLFNPNCKLGPVRIEYGDTSVTLVIIASSRGDLNCDCAIDFDDIDAFVAALVGRDQFGQQYPDCDFNRGDINCDGSVDFDDIDSFVNCIIIGECDACP